MWPCGKLLFAELYQFQQCNADFHVVRLSHCLIAMVPIFVITIFVLLFGTLIGIEAIHDVENDFLRDELGFPVPIVRDSDPEWLGFQSALVCCRDTSCDVVYFACDT